MYIHIYIYIYVIDQCLSTGRLLQDHRRDSALQHEEVGGHDLLSLSIYIYIYVYVCICICKYTYIYIYIYTQIRARMCAHKCVIVLYVVYCIIS